MRSLVRILGDTVQGSLCLALMGALSEMYQEYAAATILEEMTKAMFEEPAARNISPGLKPSIRHWRTLLRACQGCLARSEFPLLVSQMMTLVSDGFVRRKQVHWNDVAGALLRIAKASSGSIDSVSLLGGVDGLRLLPAGLLECA